MIARTLLSRKETSSRVPSKQARRQPPKCLAGPAHRQGGPQVDSWAGGLSFDEGMLSVVGSSVEQGGMHTVEPVVGLMVEHASEQTGTQAVAQAGIQVVISRVGSLVENTDTHVVVAVIGSSIEHTGEHTGRAAGGCPGGGFSHRLRGRSTSRMLPREPC